MAGERDIEAAVEQTMVDELYERSILSQPALLLVLLLLRSVLGPIYEARPEIQRAFFAVYCVIAARVVLTLLGRRRRGPFASVRVRHALFGLGSTAAACGLLGIQLVSLRHLDPTQFALFAICQAGTAAVALLSLGSSPVLYLAYMLPTLLPMAVFALLSRPELRTLPLMIVLFATVLALMVLKEHKTRTDNVRLRLEIADMALRDALTGVRNRRFLTELMTLEAPRVRRDPSRPLVLMMLDVDHFKQVNDERGHEAGDRVLEEIAGVLARTVRAEDVVVRWGGEEFVVVARADAKDAAETGALLAERIRRRVAEHPFAVAGGPLNRTCSIGWTVFPFGDLRWEQALSLADSALYRAKRAGRDRVVGVLPGQAVEAFEPESDLDSAASSSTLRLVETAAVEDDLEGASDAVRSLRSA
ncbi:MAG: GGDEF domain-containing protein [Myxococcales bacterium]|nr:GGDEF domain-containing protein [Myxococcales bacterium]